MGQDLQKYQWKNRVILIEGDQADKIAKQKEEFARYSKDFKERKLIFLSVKKPGFKVSLIGLDGGVKLTRKEVLEAQTLFNTIDAMPMRMAEIRNKDVLEKN